jgi:hypothetical protein
MNRLAAAVVVAVSIVLAGAPASAHRLDEYLQAMRVDVRADGIVVELDLTPGAAIAPGILAALDQDSDGAIDRVERDAYVAGVIRSLDVTLDGRRVVLAEVSCDFPSSDELRAGTGVVRLVLEAELVQSSGPHRLVADNGYRRDVGAYLANALRPESDAITIAAQQRDPRQQTLTIDYVVGRPLLTRASWTAAAALLIALRFYRRQWTLGVTYK